MGMVVRTNVMAINANRSLGINNSQVSKNLEKLSSGFRINRAADDSAGLAISEKMKAQIKGLEQASLNSQDGISLVQTAEGALTEVHDMLNRMKELATKSGNGTIQDSVDREAIQKEVDKLNAEIDRIAESTNFNGINLLDGSLSTTGGAGGASNIKVQTDGTIAEEAAVQGSGATKALSSVTGGADGDSVTISVGLSNGKAINLELIKKGDTLVDKDGNVLGAATTAGATAGEVQAAALKALQKSSLSKDFNITDAAGVITFEAKTAGSAAPQVTSFSEKSTIKSTGVDTTKDQAITATKGTDAYQKLDITTLKTFDGTNADEAVFTVNGKKFAVVSFDADAAKQAAILEKLDKSVNYVIAAAAGAAPATADRQGLVDLINQKTGLAFELGAAAGDINMKTGDSGVAGSGGLSLQIGDTGDAFNKVTVSVQDMSSKGIGTKGLDVSGETQATEAIETIKDAINYVSGNRSELGALQNRLEHTINNLDVAAENMTSANSRIRDTDMAKQMMEYTKMNVLTQSAQAMLAQANQQPQSILQLLQ